MATFEHFGDGDIAPPLMVDIDDTDQDAVAVEAFAQFAGIQESIIPAGFEFDKTEAIRMGGDGSGKQIQSCCRGVAATPVQKHLSVTDHRLQPALQGVQTLWGFQFQGFGQLFQRQGTIGITQELQQSFTTENGVVVFLGLPMEMRISAAAMACRGLPRLRLAGMRFSVLLRTRLTRSGLPQGFRHPGRQTRLFLVFRGFFHAHILHASLLTCR